MHCHQTTHVIQSIVVLFVIGKAQSALCDGETETILCYSRRELQLCKVKEATVIINATSLTKYCIYTQGSPPEDFYRFRGVYGYYSNILWTYRCESKFAVCFTARSSTIDATTPWYIDTSSTSPLTQSTYLSVRSLVPSFKTFSETAPTGESDETTVTTKLTDSPLTASGILTSESHFSEANRPKSSAIHIAAIAGTVCLVIVVALSGICIWRKRGSRDNHSKNDHDEGDQPISNIYANNYMDLQDPVNNHTYLSVGNRTNNIDSRTKPVEYRNNSLDKTTDDNNYIPMDGHVNGDVAIGNDSNYYNSEGRDVTFQQTYENIRSKCVNMETAAKTASDNYDYLHAVA